MQQKVLEFIVDDQFIRAPHYTVVADSKDYLVARFTFSPQWQGLVKTAVFQAADGKAYFVVLDKDTCPIPQEVIQPTNFLVSVFGGDRLTTDRAMVEVVASGFTAKGTTPPQPTPDVYNQLMEAVSTERQLAEAAATTAAEKADLCVESTDSCATFALAAENAATTAEYQAEECTRLVSSAQSLLENATDIGDQINEIYDVEHRVRMDAVFTDERATAAEENASLAEEHKTEAVKAATEAANFAAQMEQMVSRQLLTTFTVTDPTAEINIVFEKPVKDFYLVFKGQLQTDNAVNDAILACRADKGGQYFFYAPGLKFPVNTPVAFIAHAQNIVGTYWATAFSNIALSAGLQGSDSSTCTLKNSYSQRKPPLAEQLTAIQFFEFNRKYLFATGSTIEVWGVYAE